MTGGGVSLMVVERARQFLAECRDMDEVRLFKNKAEAVARYQRTLGAAEDSGVSASIIARRAERRLGELIAEMPKAKGAKAGGKKDSPRGRIVEPRDSEPTLADHGISKSQSSRWQAVAEIPLEKFEAAMTHAVEQKKQPTTAGLVRLSKPPKAKPLARQRPPEKQQPQASSPEHPQFSSLRRLAEQRASDPEYSSLRQTQKAVMQAMPPSRAQRMVDFVLDGGELAMLLLGVDWTVTRESLNAAYRVASKTAHPDRGGTAGAFAELTRARDLVAQMLGT